MLSTLNSGCKKDVPKFITTLCELVGWNNYSTIGWWNSKLKALRDIRLSQNIKLTLLHHQLETRKMLS